MMSWLSKLLIGKLTSFQSIGGVPVDVFQGLPSNSVLLCFTSWENQKIVDLHKSGSSLGAISRHLKVPRSSVQTIVCKSKHHGTRSRLTAQEGDAFCLLEMNVLWCPDLNPLSGGMGQISPNLLWEACGRLPETFDLS